MSQSLAPHTTTTRLIHWGAAALLVGTFAVGLTLEDWPRGPQRDWVMMLHYSLGSIVLASVLVRLLRRLLVVQPAPGWAGRLAGAAHLGLYGLMLGLPLTGALDRWARGRPLSLFGQMVPAPFPIPGGKLWEEVHGVLAWTLAALVAAHIAAALWHHLVLRDGVLRRMLPAG